MIIENGTIQPCIQTGGGLVDGNPVKPTIAWGDPIPANIRTNTKASVGHTNGNTFTVASYEILVEVQVFAADRVKLRRTGIDLGEFSVMDVEPLEAVGLVKITV